MNARFPLVAAALVFATTPSWAAAPVSPASAPDSLGHQFLQNVRVSTLTQVEYCLRNMPEIRLEMSLAHATYVQALDRAGDLLSRRFPGAGRVVKFRIGTDEQVRERALTLAQSYGPDRLCVAMLFHMHNATGESLARQFEQPFAQMLESIKQ